MTQLQHWGKWGTCRRSRLVVALRESDILMIEQELLKPVADKSHSGSLSRLRNLLMFVETKRA